MEMDPEKNVALEFTMNLVGIFIYFTSKVQGRIYFIYLEISGVLVFVYPLSIYLYSDFLAISHMGV